MLGPVLELVPEPVHVLVLALPVPVLVLAVGVALEQAGWELQSRIDSRPPVNVHYLCYHTAVPPLVLAGGLVEGLVAQALAVEFCP